MIKAESARLYSHVEFLTQIRPFRNYRNLASLKQASDYIRSSFQEFGLTTLDQQWEAEGNTYTNVIASYQPDAPRKLVVGAHYDVAGDQPGADDNASAVAGLLETARLLSENRPQLDYGVEFVSYCLEEPPFFTSDLMGSYIHAKSLKDQKTPVLGMICYEMIGYFSDEPGSQQYPSPEFADRYPSAGNFIIVVGVQQGQEFNRKFFNLMREGSEVDVQMVEFPEKSGLAAMSDQLSYWKFGYDALMINDTSFLRNPNYHEETDTIDTLDFEKMRAVVDGCYRGIVGLE